LAGQEPPKKERGLGGLVIGGLLAWQFYHQGQNQRKYNLAANRPDPVATMRAKIMLSCKPFFAVSM
jgi:hypothetical protein